MKSKILKFFSPFIYLITFFLIFISLLLLLMMNNYSPSLYLSSNKYELKEILEILDEGIKKLGKNYENIYLYNQLIIESNESGLITNISIEFYERSSSNIYQINLSNGDYILSNLGEIQELNEERIPLLLTVLYPVSKIELPSVNSRIIFESDIVQNIRIESNYEKFKFDYILDVFTKIDENEEGFFYKFVKFDYYNYISAQFSVQELFLKIQ